MAKREPLYPHVPKSREAQFPHRTSGESSKQTLGVLPDGQLVLLKSGTEGWIKGRIVEYFDLIPSVGGMIYAGPGYKVSILEGKHKGQVIQVPINYVKAMFPHVPKGRQAETKLPQTLPLTTKKPTRDDVTVESWMERDRLGIWITDKRTDKTIAEWWDEDARQMFEDGFFKPGVPQRTYEKPGREFVESVLDYAESVGLLAGGKFLHQTPEISASTINLLAKTEGNPIRKFCCRQCDECAPKELLEEGRFPDRMEWLRDHYKEKHPGMWGKMLPMTMGEGGELVSPKYRHLTGWVSEPLPREAE